MSSLFGRGYKLTIKRGADELIYGPPMQVRFLVEVRPGSSGSIAEITLYGASRDTRRAIYNQFDEIRLEAGFTEKGISTIFSGSIINHATGRDGVDTYIRFYCRTTGKAQAESFISKSWGENTPAIDIIRDVAQTMLLPVEFVGDFSDLPKAIKGATICMPSVSSLDRLSRDYGFDWVLSSNKITISRINPNGSRAARDAPPHLISISTGMIGTPQILIQQVEVKKLLDPTINPGDVVDIQAETRDFASSNVYVVDRASLDPTGGNGLYSVITVRHLGDFSGNTWETVIGGVRRDQ